MFLGRKGWMSGWVCLTVVALAFWAAPLRASDTVTSFADITYWVGTGSNEAALVLDWNDGKDPLVMGYRWDGSATGQDMIFALAQANDDFYITTGDFGGGLGIALFGVGYDRDGDGFGVTPTGAFVDGRYEVGRDSPNDGRVATDPDDSYTEGWWQGYWSYYLAGTGGILPLEDGSADAWSYSGTGITNRILSDGDWDGWSFVSFTTALDPDPYPSAPRNIPAATTPVPEPRVASLGLVILGLLCVTRYRGRRSAALA
jgi:hypothetical protein